MPFLLTFAGLIMIVSGTRNTHVALAKQVQSDFTGQGNFITWIVAIGAVGSLGYIDALRTFSKYFMSLIIIGFILSNKGFFAQFTAALKSGPIAPQAASDGSGGTVGALPAPVTDATAATMSQGDIAAKITGNQTGLFGQTPATEGQAKFNGWMNYIFSGKFLQ